MVKSRKNLSFDETQEVITPFAFKLDRTLFGEAIASPYKRVSALGIDLLLIGILSSAGGELLAIVLAILVFRQGKVKPSLADGKPVKGSNKRFVMRLIGSTIVFIVLLKVLVPMLNGLISDEPRDVYVSSNGTEKTPGNSFVAGEEVSLSQAVQIAALSINVITKANDKNCQKVDCWYSVFSDIPEHMISLGLNERKARELLIEVSQETQLLSEQQNILVTRLMADFVKQSIDIEKQLQDKNSQVLRDKKQKKDSQELTLETGTTYEHVDSKFSSKPVYSIMGYIKGIVEDLGLGFGWAALYFTVFIAKWHGQTPGKRLFNIRVQQLDGTPMTLWGSFGRYGGYGAGIATGLLGFLQVFWDPNRQAIHDKISATVVTDDKKIVDPDIIELALKKIKDFNATHHEDNGKTDGAEVVSQ